MSIADETDTNQTMSPPVVQPELTSLSPEQQADMLRIVESELALMEELLGTRRRVFEQIKHRNITERYTVPLARTGKILSRILANVMGVPDEH